MNETPLKVVAPRARVRAGPKPHGRAGGPGRPKLHKEAVDRRDVILDSAEALFCVHGFHGVTIREVAKEAGVDPALLNYYFTSKRGLFDAVFLRKADFINQQRLHSMNRYEGSTAGMTVEGCLQSFFEPVLWWWETGGDGSRNYLRLVAVVNNAPSWGAATMAKYFDPVVHRLIATRICTGATISSPVLSRMRSRTPVVSTTCRADFADRTMFRRCASGSLISWRPAPPNFVRA